MMYTYVHILERGVRGAYSQINDFPTSFGCSRLQKNFLKSEFNKVYMESNMFYVTMI